MELVSLRDKVLEYYISSHLIIATISSNLISVGPLPRIGNIPSAPRKVSSLTNDWQVIGGTSHHATCSALNNPRVELAESGIEPHSSKYRHRKRAQVTDRFH